MKENERNKRFEKTFKKLFPEAYKKRQEQLKKKTNRKKYDEKKGMGPEEFFNKDKKEAQRKKENELWGEPDQVTRFKRGPWTVVRKVWNTDEGMKMKEYTENNDGSLNDQGNPSPLGFGQMMGFIMNPKDLFYQFTQMNEEMDDLDMEDEEMLKEMFGTRERSGMNHFTFEDDPSDPASYDPKFLEMMLEEALKEEDYETAAQIRDMIEEKKNSNDPNEG